MLVKMLKAAGNIFFFTVCLSLLSACGGKQADMLFTADRQAVEFEGAIQYRRYFAAVTDRNFLYVGVSGDGRQVCMTVRGDSADGREFLINPQEDWGIGLPDVRGITAPSSGQPVFFVADGAREQGKRDWLNHYYVVRTDMEGRMREKLDILPVLREKGIWESSGYVSGPIECDGEGRLCLLDPGTGEAHFLDREGNYITGCQFGGTGAERGLQCVRTDRGEVLAAGRQGSAWEFVGLDAESGSVRKVCAAEISGVKEWYGMWGDVLYYRQGGRLAAWDITSGERRCLYNLAANGADLAVSCFLPSDEGGALLAAQNGEAFLLKLTDREPERAGELLVVNVSRTDDFLQSGIFAFSRRNERYGVQYRDLSREEGGRERIYMEMSKDGGPDLLYVSWEDMRDLWRKGVLGDLNLLLSEEVRDVLYPAARRVGDMEGQLAGIPLYAVMETLWITGEYWQEESWSREDVLRILREHEEISGIVLDSHGRDSYETNLRFFLGDDLLDSPYIRDGHADFDTEEFREILTWVKKKTTFRDAGEGLGDDYDFLRGGGYLGIYRTLYDLNNYHNYLNWIGADAHVAGLPSEGGRRIPLGFDGILVVNRNAMDKPGVGELVNYLLDFETQRRCIRFCGMSVRSDIMERCIEFEDIGREYGFREQDGTLIILSGEEEGPPRVAEYEALWRDAVYIGDSCGELFRIIIEEANAYFYSDVDPDRVIDNMTRRVQAYLDGKD